MQLVLANALLALTWIAVTAYVLLAGADFGGGAWDLLAGGPQRGKRTRALIEHSLGPVWEANHVWLIFVLVLVWTAFPRLFASVASTLYIPMSLIAIGIIVRGSGFAFRKVVTEVWQQRLFGAAFAASSVLTPFFLGTMAGAIITGRVPVGVAAGNVITSWLNPTGLVTGALTVVICAYLAATFLTADGRRAGDIDLADYFRRRALLSGILAAALAAAALITLSLDSPAAAHRIFTAGLPLTVLSVVAGLLSLLLQRRAFTLVRITAGLTVTAVIWAWAMAQYPQLLPGLTVAQGAAPTATLAAIVGSSIVGMILLAPSLVWLFVLFQRTQQTAPGDAPHAAH